MVGQGPAVLAAGTGWVGCCFQFSSILSFLLYLQQVQDGWAAVFNSVYPIFPALLHLSGVTAQHDHNIFSWDVKLELIHSLEYR